MSLFELIEDAGTGGWEKVFVGGAINPAEEQIGKQHATYKYMQTGSAVGLFNYPPVPPPVWPGSLKRPNPRLSYTSPQMVGNVLTNYGISWAYEYESPHKLFGKPHTFIG